MFSAVGLIALGIVWLLVPLWLVGSLYVGWEVLAALQRQSEALETLAGNAVARAPASADRSQDCGSDYAE